MAQAEIGLDDLRLVRAIADAGSLTAAARSLGVDHSTAFRRLNAIEARLGTRLFERRRDGYLPTPAGHAASEAARRIADEMASLALHLAGSDLRPYGVVRVTTTDTLVDLLTPALAAFRVRYPEIVPELVVANAFLSLSRRDADVAIRPAASAPEELVGRRTATIATAIYGTPELTPDGAAAWRPEDQVWIGYDASLSHLAAARWLAANVPDTRIGYRADTLLAMRAAARAGIGLALLPCFLADPEPALFRVQPPDPALATGLWLLTHPELRRVPRVRVFLDHMAEALAGLKGEFGGA